jgi:hypothetical protein
MLKTTSAGESDMGTGLQSMIEQANRKASVGRQKVFAKKSYIKTTELQLIDLLRERVQDALDCFYRNTGDMSQAMKALRECDALVGKRVVEITKTGVSRA